METTTLNLIAEQADAHRLTLFVGADLPKELTGIPSRQDLARDLAVRYGLDLQSQAPSFAAVTQRIGRRGDVLRYLIGRLDTAGMEPQRFDSLLAQLTPVQRIITTRYDGLLERAFQAGRRRLDVLRTDLDASVRGGDDPLLVMLYGDLDHVQTVTLTEDDLYDLATQKRGLLNLVEQAFTSTTVLFLGHDLSSPDFLMLWREVLRRYSDNAPRAYATTTGPVDDSERNMWLRRNIELLEAGPLQVIEALAQRLVGAPVQDQQRIKGPSGPTPTDENGTPALTTGEHSRLLRQLEELQRKYNTLTQRIAALDTDMGRTTEAFRRQPLEERRQEYVGERDQVAREMAEIERKLGGDASITAPSGPAAPEPESVQIGVAPLVWRRDPLRSEPADLAESDAAPPVLEPPMKAYRNFDLELNQVDGKIEARILYSPAGESTASSTAFDTLPEPLDRLASLQGLDEEIGRRLLPGEVRERWAANQATADQAGDGLRLRLFIRDRTLAGVAWEAASVNHRQLALRPKTPMVRYVPADRAPQPLRVSGPLRLLVLLSATAEIGLEALDKETERSNLQEALGGLERQGKVQLHWLEGAITRSKLQDSLRRLQPHVLHFMGHGSYDTVKKQGNLILARTDSGAKPRPDPLGTRELGLLLDDSTVKFALLNACQTGVAAGGLAEALVREALPAALGMQASVKDKAAARFAGAFYRALADRWPIDAAVTEGRKDLALEVGLNSPQWAMPVLYMRAPDGQLFE